jgi:hypothetical protein
MGKKNGLKDLDIRIRLPWKDDPREARKLYKQICRSDDPENEALRIKKEFKL